MASTRGWWTLTSTVDLNDVDRAHIARQVRNGFTSGEVAITLDPANGPHTGAVPRSWVNVTGVLSAHSMLLLLANVDSRGIAHDDLDGVRRVWNERKQ